MTDEMKDIERKNKTVSIWIALIPVLALMVFIGVTILVFHGDPQIPLILATVVAAVVARCHGLRWRFIEEGLIDGIRIAMTAILILMVIGIMIGTWIASGIVPILIYYGLKLLNSGVFLIAACLICSVVSLATGSSWTTAGTVGVALIGVGQGLGVPVPMVAGAIVSGSYFGDKMSPLSDSTNLAPAVAGSELFEHIRHMVYTTLPALLISLVIYAGLGFFVVNGQGDPAGIQKIQELLETNFNLHPVLLIPPALVVLMVIYRIPALPALIGGALLGGLLAMIFQGTSLKEIFAVAQDGYASQTGVPAVDDLLSRGGLSSMMYTVSLIFCALAFGGVMERAGMLAAIANGILKLARSTGSLILATVGTCIGMNVIAPDQYLSIIVPGRMYREAFESRGIALKNLSRSLEDGGTLSSPLVPWNTCGAFMTSALMVSPLAYAPYAYLNLLSPAVAVVLGYTGWTIAVSRGRESPVHTGRGKGTDTIERGQTSLKGDRHH